MIAAPARAWSLTGAPMLALGGLLLAAAVALDAYAAHAAVALDSERLHTAARYLALHGLALLALARPLGAAMLVALSMAIAGCLLFVGSLLAEVAWDWSTRAAPWGGSLMILGWLLVALSGAVAAWRGRRIPERPA